ncbi:MAG: thermonuclease family protein [Cyclobacteriaceae bacterium]
MSWEFGPEAKAFLEKYLLRKQVVVKNHGKDRLKNYIGVVLHHPGLRQATIHVGTEAMGCFSAAPIKD